MGGMAHTCCLHWAATLLVATAAAAAAATTTTAAAAAAAASAAGAAAAAAPSAPEIGVADDQPCSCSGVSAAARAAAGGE